MKTHIGNKIKELLDEKKIGVTKFARMINVTPNSAYVMLKKDLLHPKWIETISEVLEYDLFQHYYTPHKNLSVKQTESDLTELRKAHEELKSKFENLEKENLYLKEINELLRKKGGQA